MSLFLSLGRRVYLPAPFSACITSVVRIYYAIRILKTGDMTYNFVVLGLWSHAEITFGIICGCLPVLPRFFLALRLKISMLSKSCVPIQIIPQGFRFSRFSGKHGDADSSGCTGKGPYELQRECHSGEVYELNPTGQNGSTADTKVRSLASPVGDPTTGAKSLEKGPNTNRILKTVHIETIQEPRDDPDLDIEMQPSIPAW